jgi:hypothetical protein
MSDQINTYESEYRKYAEAFGRAALQGDTNGTRENFGKLATVRAKLKACGKKGEALLRCLMRDNSDAVAVRAAIDSLPFSEEEGLEVLDAIARKSGPIAFDARMTAKLWRAGELRKR